MKIFLSSVLLTITATPAFAAPVSPVTSIVRTADLDLASQAGQRVLDRRLTIAIADVCGTASDADLVGQNEVRRCRVATRRHVASDRDQRIAASSGNPIEIAAR